MHRADKITALSADFLETEEPQLLGALLICNRPVQDYFTFTFTI